MSKYLEVKRDKYDKLRSRVAELQELAVTENRDLTEAEAKEVREAVAAGKPLADEIRTLAEAAERDAAVAGVAAHVEVAREREVATSDTTAADRDPGHYRSVADGGRHSFFGDQFRAMHEHDRDAAQRVEEYQRAVTQANGGAPGSIVPPKWLSEEYLAIARQGRIVADSVRKVPLGTDPRPLNLPKQVTGTDANIATQTTEGVNNAGWGTDRFTASSDTLTPVAQAAYQDVSRQLLGASDPAADALIFADLQSAWAFKVEQIVCAAIMAGGTALNTFATDNSIASGTATASQWNFFTGGDPAGASGGSAAVNWVIDGQTAVASDLRGPADLVIMSYRRFGSFRKLHDGQGRPLMPVSQYAPQNATGVVSGVLRGEIEGVNAVGTAGISGSYAEKYAVLRSQAVLLAESDVLAFTYDQVVGPSAVRMGIWGYVGTLVRNPGSVQVTTITAA